VTQFCKVAFAGRVRLFEPSPASKALKKGKVFMTLRSTTNDAKRTLERRQIHPISSKMS